MCNPKAPSGKTRVIGIKLFNSEGVKVRDCDDVSEAIEITNDLNKHRCSSFDDLFCAFDDKGHPIPGLDTEVLHETIN